MGLGDGGGDSGITRTGTGDEEGWVAARAYMPRRRCERCDASRSLRLDVRPRAACPVSPETRLEADSSAI